MKKERMKKLLEQCYERKHILQEEGGYEIENSYQKGRYDELLAFTVHVQQIHLKEITNNGKET